MCVVNYFLDMRKHNDLLQQLKTFIWRDKERLVNKFKLEQNKEINLIRELLSTEKSQTTKLEKEYQELKKYLRFWIEH